MAKKGKTFRLQLRIDLCKGCRLCVDFCPKKVLGLTADRFNKKGVPYAEVLRAGDCVGCGSCTAVCPDGVIEIFEVEQGDHG